MPILERPFDHGLDPMTFVEPVEVDEGWLSPPTPVARFGPPLLKALARAGWDVPGVEVGVVTLSAEGRMYRAVDRVTFEDGDGRTSLLFDVPRGSGGVPFDSILSAAELPDGAEIRWEIDGSGPSASLRLDDEGRRVRDRRARRVEYGVPGGHDRDALPPERGSAVRSARGPDAPATLSAFALRDEIGARAEALVRRLLAMPFSIGSRRADACGTADFRRLTARPATPAPSGFPTLYGYVEETALGALSTAFGPAGLPGPPGHRAGGLRLVPLGVRDPVGRMTADAHRGFLYLSTEPSRRDLSPRADPRPTDMPVAVDLAVLDHAFVFDGRAHGRERERCVARAIREGRTHLTNEEVNGCLVTAGRTLVPLAGYDGRFVEPVYVVDRYLEPSEIRLMSGRVDVRDEGGEAVLAMTDGLTGIVSELSRLPLAPYNLERLARAAETVAFHAGTAADRTTTEGECA